ncbi:MAG TPA: glutamate synthase subunit beta [Planctomycetota bacterium]|nr:glutamate synthase subunit beta [Planctomycetota bacterium]
MGKPTGFMEATRELPRRRLVEERIKDWNEVYLPFPDEKLKTQAARCMDCGVPFCNNGCPLGNIIPDWNDLIYKNRWREAIDRLHLTNNFPEFTGRLCPAPCEASCVLGINEPAVTIKLIEQSIIDRAWQEGWVKPQPPEKKTGKKIAVVGSGPAGLAAAQQLARVGHEVTVFERADAIGGLLRYGIPEFKMEKRYLDRRLKQMEAEGVKFVVNANIGVTHKVDDLRGSFDAIVLCGGATHGRDLTVPGRELKGTYFAMEYLPQANKVARGEKVENQILATGKHVIIIGGGDTGADCLGTAIRQGAKSIRNFELLPKPPNERAPSNPWPQWPNIFRTSSAHEENECRDYSIQTTKLTGENGVLKKLHAVRLNWVPNPAGGPPKPEPIPGTEFTVDADLILLAMGFVGPEKPGMLTQLGVKLTERGNVWADENKMTSIPGIFTAGDMTRGQSLIVWAIAEGRNAAYGVDKYLMGETTLKKSF